MAATHGTGYGAPVKEPDDYPFAKMSISHEIIRSRRHKAGPLALGSTVAWPESNCYFHSLAFNTTS
jgi:hypothetical protein